MNALNKIAAWGRQTQHNAKVGAAQPEPEGFTVTPSTYLVHRLRQWQNCESVPEEVALHGAPLAVINLPVVSKVVVSGKCASAGLGVRGK